MTSILQNHIISCYFSNIDRVAMSVAIIPMGVDLSLDESTKGLIAGMFSIGYMFGLLPAGLIGSFFSPKVLLAVGVTFWSISQMLSPYCAMYSMPALYVCRFIMGAAEACIGIMTRFNFTVIDCTIF